MDDTRIYHIHINGQVIGVEIDAFSPPGWKIELNEKGFSILTVKTDQAGLIGLIRHLHGLGFDLISIDSN